VVSCLEKPASRQILERIVQFSVLQNIEESIYDLGKLISLSEDVGIEDLPKIAAYL
jgi:hypothetical protein